MEKIRLQSGLPTGELSSFQLQSSSDTIMGKNGWLHISYLKRNKFAELVICYLLLTVLCSHVLEEVVFLVISCSFTGSFVLQRIANSS